MCVGMLKSCWLWDYWFVVVFCCLSYCSVLVKPKSAPFLVLGAHYFSIKRYWNQSEWLSNSWVFISEGGAPFSLSSCLSSYQPSNSYCIAFLNPLVNAPSPKLPGIFHRIEQWTADIKAFIIHVSPHKTTCNCSPSPNWNFQCHSRRCNSHIVCVCCSDRLGVENGCRTPWHHVCGFMSRLK